MRAALLAIVGTALATSAASAQLTIVNNIPGAFVDISGTGTNLGLETDDGALSFNATHGNLIVAAGPLFIGTNGQATNVSNTAFTNAAMPYPTGFGYAPLWDDFRTDSGGGDIFFQNNADRTIVQWNNLRTFATPGTDLGTWQLQIFSSGPILAQYIYQDVIFGNASDNGGSGTIGVEAADGTFAQWSFNTASIQNGTVLTVLVPAPGAACLLGLGGLVACRRRR
jgi:hypothetical protein